VRADLAKGVLMLRRAIEMGSPEAMNEMGRLHTDGTGRAPRITPRPCASTPPPPTTTWPAGMSNLGVVHHNGEGVPVNYTEAMHWFQMAADRGYLEAWFDLGVMCERGQGLKADNDLALLMYRRAVESKDRTCASGPRRRSTAWKASTTRTATRSGKRLSVPILFRAGFC
jgi:TPR repeat protein